MSPKNITTLSILCAVTLALAPSPAGAERLCVRKRQPVVNGTVNFRQGIRKVAGRCPGGYVPLLNTELFRGPAGEDGQLKVYGDGSEGNLTLAGYNDWSTVAYDGSLQFENLTIDAGAYLEIPSGSVIRCSGTFTNNGILNVRPGITGGYLGTNTAYQIPHITVVGQGHSRRGASSGEIGTSSQIRWGGQRGETWEEQTLRNLLKPGAYGGGAGAGSWNTAGGYGGGSLVILAEDGIVNNGEILADGTPGNYGAGGGAGGIIILASKTSVQNSGTVSVSGGYGGDTDTASDHDQAGGGGGGGGLVHMLAPSIVPGNVTLDGGAGGAAGTISATDRSAGSGGGACGGHGGAGGDVAAGSPAVAGAGEAGQSGLLLQTTTDPTALF